VTVPPTWKMRALAAEQLLRELQGLLDRMDDWSPEAVPVSRNEETTIRGAVRVHLGSLPLKREPGPRRKK